MKLSPLIEKLECVMMSPNSKPLPTTRVLFIDGNTDDRALFVSGLQYRSPDYEIIEASDGQSGLAIYRAQRIDCVVLELDLPGLSDFEVLVDLVPLVRRPNIAVIVLTRIPDRGLHALARKNGAYTCFHKPHTSSDEWIEPSIVLLDLSA
jgi:CheY-like chemotaxis protein